MPASRSPELSEVINRAVARGQAELRVSMPVVVVSYDTSKQSVNVQPLISDLYEDQDGVTQFEDLPQINNVRVQFAAGGKMRITFPIQKDDTGIILISDRSIDTWAQHGGKQRPTDRRTHALPDAVYIPGVSPSGHWSAAATDVITIGDDGQAGAMVARVGDPVQLSAGWATWFTSMQAALAAVGCPPLPNVADPTLDFGSIGSGATPPNPCGSKTTKILG